MLSNVSKYIDNDIVNGLDVDAVVSFDYQKKRNELFSNRVTNFYSIFHSLPLLVREESINCSDQKYQPSEYYYEVLTFGKLFGWFILVGGIFFSFYCAYYIWRVRRSILTVLLFYIIQFALIFIGLMIISK